MLQGVPRETQTGRVAIPPLNRAARLHPRQEVFPMPEDDRPFRRDNPPPWYTPQFEERFAEAFDKLVDDPLQVIQTWGQMRELCNALRVPITD